MECKEHELILIDENWMSDSSLLIITECQKCKEKFQGLLIKREKDDERV